MKTLKALAILAVGLLATACQLAQLQASATYIAAEVASTAILNKNPKLVPVAQLIVTDWQNFQLGKLSAADEAVLLKDVVAATGKQLTPTQAALLDGAIQQILANQNNTAPTPLTGAAGAIITDVVNGLARALVIYTPPTALYNKPAATQDGLYAATIFVR